MVIDVIVYLAMRVPGHGGRFLALQDTQARRTLPHDSLQSDLDPEKAQVLLTKPVETACRLVSALADGA